ncbi:AAA family ATPase [Microbacterium sp. ZW T5_56]|uniref:AAA family ATPase n=1 Tax=Microbacterium sp. ZW T5_56 TaxID=3378081 RepID=UPI003853FF04
MSNRNSPERAAKAQRQEHGSSPRVEDPRAARILITGMSGTGKSTVLTQLAERGHHTVDTDYDGWVLSDGKWDEARMARLLASARAVVVSGTVENQGRFYDRFDAVVLLSAPVEVLIDRVMRRSNNPYGRSASDQAAIRRHVAEIEPLLRAGADLELDARLPVEALVAVVEELLRSPEIRPG